MPVGNLNLYDILVDLIPGTSLIGFFILYLQPTSISSGEGLILLIAGYVAGRIIHGFVSLEWVDKCRICIEERLFSDYVDERKYGLSFRNRVRAEYSDSQDGNFKAYDADNIEPELIKTTVEELLAKLPADIDAEELDTVSHQKLSEADTDEKTDNILSLRYYGENLLYGKDYLYHKYEMLATFYRSMWLVGLLAAVFYTAVLGTLLLVNVLSAGPLFSPVVFIGNLLTSQGSW
jgi:hypothetical protein